MEDLLLPNEYASRAEDGLPALTPEEEEQGLERGLNALKEGKGRALDEVRRDLHKRFTDDR